MPTIGEMMAIYAKEAVIYGNQHQKQMDYTDNSIRQVEELCAMIYNVIPRNMISRTLSKAPPEEHIIHAATILGAYVGETLIRNHGGEWSMSTNQADGAGFVLKIDLIDVYPVNKIYKRLKKGPGENIVNYYETITRQLGNNK